MPYKIILTPFQVIVQVTDDLFDEIAEEVMEEEDVIEGNILKLCLRCRHYHFLFPSACI